MRIIALGDTHGRTNWKSIVRNNDSDKVVFIGDYFDTHEDASADQQISNFKEIIAYKKANIDKVILLVGNHDYHYMRGAGEHYSGFQEWRKTDIQEVLHAALDLDLLQMCHLEGNFLFSHAGVTKTWCDRNFTFASNFKLPDLVEAINEKFKYQPGAFRFTPGTNCSMYGDDITQPPIWVRPRSLFMDKIQGCTHVVGHTTQDEISLGSRDIYPNGIKTSTAGVILIDALGTSGEYLEINNGTPRVAK